MHMIIIIMFVVGNYLRTALFLIALLLPVFADHKLKIVSPTALASLFPKGHIALHASSIGQIPVHSIITGVLCLGEPADGCSELTPRERPASNLSTAYLHEFVLLTSKNCANSAKANNVYSMGGYAALITKDNGTQIDRHGTKVGIPVMQIAAYDSALITDYQQQHPTEFIVASIEFDRIHKFNRTEVEIWFSSSDTEAYSFINNFSGFANSQNSQVLFTPRFFTTELNEHNGEEEQLAHYIGCLSSGRYCAPEIQYQTRLEGKQVVEEDLRQLIIRKTTGKYWDYCKYWASQCLSGGKVFMNHGDALECSKKCMLRVGLNPSDIQQQQVNSYRGGTPQINDNEYLLEERQAQILRKVDEHPFIFVNGRAPKVTVHSPLTKKQKVGSLSDTIKYEVCKRQSPDYSKACQQFSQDFVPFTSTTGWIITLTIILLIVFMAISLLIYKCIMRYRMKREIKGEVFKTLEQYYHYSKVHGKGKENEMKEIRRDTQEEQRVAAQ